jgi:hypothetical protein
MIIITLHFLYYLLFLCTNLVLNNAIVDQTHFFHK